MFLFYYIILLYYIMFYYITLLYYIILYYIILYLVELLAADLAQAAQRAQPRAAWTGSRRMLASRPPLRSCRVHDGVLGG